MTAPESTDASRCGISIARKKYASGRFDKISKFRAGPYFPVGQEASKNLYLVLGIRAAITLRSLW